MLIFSRDCHVKFKTKTSAPEFCARSTLGGQVNYQLASFFLVQIIQSRAIKKE